MTQNKNQIFARLAALWTSLTEPDPSVKEEDRPRVRILAGSTLVFLPIGLFVVILTPLIALFNNQPVTTSPVYFVGVGISAIAYFFSRSRYYNLGAWMLVMDAPFVVVVSVWTESTSGASAPMLFFLSLSVILAGLVLSPWETLLSSTFVGIAIIILPVNMTPTASPPTYSAFGFALIVAALTVVVGLDRENNLRRLKQSRVDLQKSLEETEEARQRAENSDKVKSAFLASMSHELRTPLNAVINFTRFVIDGDTGPVNEEQTELLTEVVGSAKHLLNLINDVLDMSKIEAGSLSLFIEDNLNLNTIIDGVVPTARSLITGKPVRLHTDVDANIPLMRGDRQRIVQILLNIVSNACKFTDEGEIKISAHHKNEEVLIAVTDTGPGIAVEDQENVFAAFKQTKGGIRKGGGTGLGMPIAKSLAEAHGGRLWLESQPGKGSTFYVMLPIQSKVLTPTLV